MSTFLITLLASVMVNVIPQPVSVEMGEGFFDIAKSRHNIQYTINPESGIAAEGYTLTVTPKGIRVLASDEAGIFYAKQTLKQLIQADGTVPCLQIKDYPRFAWRGFHIDPCRHFISVEDVKKQIDLLSQYKMNVMHWHLTDDQGWRIEIKKYPLLAEVSAWRTEFDGSVHGGYYTQEQIRDVVAYAAERHVTVVPEIEMPGHAISAIRAYPWLSCTGEEVKTFYTWGTPDISLCVGKESTFEFLDNVIAEVVELFPSEYIHIGGDECRKNRWEQCPLCQERIAEQGIVADEHATAEEKLQSYAIHRMEGILAKYGRKLIGWDEILEGGLAPTATVMSWRGEEGGKKAAAAGHEVVMTPGSGGMYFDHFQGDPKIEPATIGNYTTLEKVYSYDPVPAELRDAGKGGLVKGVQCNNWSEYMYEPWQRWYMLLPRAFALAEIAWTPLERKCWPDFCRRVEVACKELDEMGIPYHIPLPEQPEGSCNELAFQDEATVAFKTTRLMEMVYTLDGSEPTVDSRRYMWPFKVTEDTDIKIATLTPHGKLSPVRTVHVRKCEPMPALDSSAMFKGMRARRTDGKFVTAADIKDAEWKEVSIAQFGELTSLEPYNRNLPDSTRFYAAEAEGCFSVPKTGTYRFSSDCDMVWVDDVLTVDNSGEVKRYSRHDRELVLEKGTHKVKALFIYNVIGGWNNLRGKTDVNIMPAGGDWKKIKVKP
ncbi:MAG: family 20 glycosylhydrolase [Bacteroidales bacterium]|nr:family 20 glycosylhydrolase [Bacteroidales bacterium]